MATRRELHAYALCMLPEYEMLVVPFVRAKKAAITQARHENEDILNAGSWHVKIRTNQLFPALGRRYGDSSGGAVLGDLFF